MDNIIHTRFSDAENVWRSQQLAGGPVQGPANSKPIGDGLSRDFRILKTLYI